MSQADLQMVDYFLEVGGKRFVVSEPEPEGGRLSVGVLLPDAPELARMRGKVGRLVWRTGDELETVRVLDASADSPLISLEDATGEAMTEPAPPPMPSAGPRKRRRLRRTLH